MNVRHFEEARRRRILESEYRLFGWRYLIERMRGEGRDVTVASDLLKAFEDDLERHRCSQN